jgi:two-component system, cell cycle sensor histidine kinase and response regulator CckA
MHSPGSRGVWAFLIWRDLEDFLMANKPTYEELEQRVKELEKSSDIRAQFGDRLQILQLAIEQSSEGYAVSDMDGNLEYLNDAFAQVHGYPAEELIGKNLSIFHTPEQIPSVEEANREIKQTGTFKGEIWHTRHDGTVFPTMMNNSVIKDDTGKPVGMMGRLRDISDIKQAEEALQEGEENFRALYNNSPDMYVSVSPDDANILLCNDTLLNKTGYSREEIIGSPIFKMYHDDCVAEAKKAFQQFVETGVINDKKLTLKRKDGSKIDVSLNVNAIRDEAGEIKYSMSSWRDISAHKRTLEALRESEALLVMAGRTARFGGWSSDSDGHEVVWSEQVALIHEKQPGYSPTIEEAIQHYAPEWRDKIAAAYQICIREGTPYDEELEIITAGGHRLWVRTTGEAVRDKMGEIVRVQGSFQDISERKRTEQALENNQNFLNRIIDQSPFATWISDEKGTMIKCNAALKKFLNITDEQLIGKYNVFEDEVAIEQGLMPKIRTVFEDGKTANFSVEWDAGELGYKDAKKVHIEGTMFPIHDDKGDLTNVVDHWIDITEKKLAEEQLRQSEEKYRSMMEAMKDPIYICSPDFRVEYMNPSMIQRTGRDGTGEKCFKALHDLDEKCPWCTHDEAQQPEYCEDDIVTPKDNRSYHVSASPIIRGDGSISKMTVLRDTTDLRKLEAQLQQAQKMEAIGTLAGGIAHDFNNLLMTIQGRTSIMLMKKDSSHPDIRHLKGIEGNIESAADLTRQLLGFARGGKYEVKPTDLNELVKKENRMFGRTKKQISIRGKYEKDLWSVEVDQGQIAQVLLNLYVNAWQAMAAGGDLYLETENITLDEDYAKPFSIAPGRYVKISVTDNGTGMDKATQEKIFEPFFTTKEMGRGTGLGLASVYGIIKNHGGFINVYSEKGHGTTFNIYLPASEKEAIEEKKPAGDTLRGTETVLFVDDEDMIIEVAEELFDQLGYKVLTARSGKEAIEIYEKNKEQIDIVLLDMIMPDMSGSDTYERMKAIDPDIKVLLSSGYSINGQATEIMDRGCNGFIQKPFKMKELSQKLREILDDK